MRVQSGIDWEIARLASRSFGVLTREELLHVGVTRSGIGRRIDAGRLLTEFPGVYRVGHRAPSREARYLAAVRACGEGAVLRGRAAGHLFGLLKGKAPPPEVAAPVQRRIEGVKTRRSRHLDARDTTTWKGIPVTTVPRTLVDLAELLSFDALSRACHEAEVLHRTTPAQVNAALGRRPKAPGTANLQRIIDGDVHVTLSKLEKRFLQRLRTAGLPLPQTNRPAGARRVDCRWPEHRLTVELDSYTYHHSRHAWEQDHRRDREAHARGDHIRRYTHHDVYKAPALMMRELVGLLEDRPRNHHDEHDRTHHGHDVDQEPKSLGL
jgi:very-short-patch-repair endonuclease